MTGKKILLVEDDPNDIELSLLALAKHNLANDVVICRDGVEAIDYLNRDNAYSGRPEGNPIVILLDLKMPRMGGMEVLRHINTAEHLKSIPVVVLTSSRENSDIKECYELGANAFVVKPVVFEKFVDIVKELGLFWVLINESPE